MPRRRDSFENLFEGLRYVENEKTFGGITVVFTAFVDDANEAMFFGLIVGNNFV